MGGLREQLEAVRVTYGELTPQAVVQQARPADHPLHLRFEWNDAVAGEKYRHVQAAELIRSVHVTYATTEDGRERRVRAFMPVYVDSAARRRTYQPTAQALANPAARAALLAECRREWQAFRSKYGALEEFAAIVTGDASSAAA